MKRSILAAACAVALAGTLTACSDDKPTVPTSSTTTQSSSSTSQSTSNTSSSSSSTATQDYNSISVFELETGMCSEISLYESVNTGTGASTYPEVDCSVPHDLEVYALFNMPDGAYPGNDAVQAAADQGCYDAFEAYVGTPYESSSVYYTFMNPSEASWGQGDREVVCLAVTSELITQSVENSGL